MYESLLQDADQLYAKKAFLTLEEVATLLNCDEQVIYNWSKRLDHKRRPPRLMVGKSIRFPKKDFIRWLADELIQEKE